MRILLSCVVALVLGIQVVTQSAAEEPYTVAYASFGPLNTTIYIANADGSDERMVISGSVLDMNPSFAPDGRSILFTSRRHGSADIYRVNTDGLHLERLTEHPLHLLAELARDDVDAAARGMGRDDAHRPIRVARLRADLRDERRAADGSGGDHEPAAIDLHRCSLL